MILAEPRGARAEFLRDGLRAARAGGGRGLRRQGRPEVPADGRRGDHPGRGLDPRDARPGGGLPGARRPDALHEGARLRRRDRRGRPDRTPSRFRLAADHAYQIPGTPHDRRLVVYERLEGPAARPRRPARPGSYAGPVREVTSEANPTFKLCRDLLSGRGIRKHGQALLAGPRTGRRGPRAVPRPGRGLADRREGPRPAGRDGPALVPAGRPACSGSSTRLGTHAPLLLVRVPEMPEWSDEDPWPEGCTLFVPFQDPENVGAVIRSAAAFGVARVVLLREAAHPFHPKARAGRRPRPVPGAAAPGALDPRPRRRPEPP